MAQLPHAAPSIAQACPFTAEALIVPGTSATWMELLHFLIALLQCHELASILPCTVRQARAHTHMCTSACAGTLCRWFLPRFSASVLAQVVASVTAVPLLLGHPSKPVLLPSAHQVLLDSLCHFEQLCASETCILLFS